MKKYFNTTGVCVENLHYMVDINDKIDKIVDLIEKNKEYILDIISQGYEGEGIAKVNDTFPVFVEGACHVLKVRKYGGMKVM